MMETQILVDILILLPVTGFLLWLFWLTAPAGRSSSLRRLDCLLALAACGVAAAVFFALHGWLDIEGMDRSMIVVAVSYLSFIASMGLSWLVRWRLGTGSGD
ncbi:hypothetical protein IC757_09545 [Wenzhouxiangella sp. AB-CW3]|uniref:hypothetical protein n=1 Tax=Wenzhouxiangella sp. AB-CW3 TaxID=2771012 RepID=UPI00168BAC0B|nr:hypothetical protein [Wenzhouxiangella sp. AB-CW3]QOC21298.1 hypothetical protein IC757_09545 [Wenzhouxiangella sp. AB-CW3]